MSEPTLNEKQRELIERIGVLHDRIGFPPATSRVLGLLLVTREPELTFDQIRETLALSKSSTSSALNLLLQVGSIEYLTRPGDRKRYFRKSYKDWEASLLGRLDVLFSLREPLREALELRNGELGDKDRAIARMVEFLGFLETEIHDAYQRWEEGQEEENADGPKS